MFMIKDNSSQYLASLQAAVAYIETYVDLMIHESLNIQVSAEFQTLAPNETALNSFSI